jgi:hypothetical protein
MNLKHSIPRLAALALLTSTPLFAQMTGTSHPEDLDDTLPSVPVDGTHYVPPSQPASSVTVTVARPAQSEPAPALYRRDDSYAAPSQTASLNPVDRSLAVTDDVNSGVIINVPVGPDELPIGTVLKAALQQPISTESTPAGARFSATLSTNISRNGTVLLPSGSLIYGRITQIHGGRRISGPSAIRLQPDSVSLPDGSVYKLNADVTDLDHFEDSHVNGEGTIVGNVHPGATGAALGLTTTSAVVAGAVIGGGVGAVVGLGVGAGVGVIWWLKHDRQQELPRGTEIVFALDSPLRISPVAH